MKLIRSGRVPAEQEIRLLMPDQRVKYLRTVGQMVRHEDGRTEYLGAIQDVTLRRSAEEALDKVRSELAHVTRAMSLGALTASIAHEVNQPLAGIVTNASTCLRMLAADPPRLRPVAVTKFAVGTSLLLKFAAPKLTYERLYARRQTCFPLWTCQNSSPQSGLAGAARFELATVRFGGGCSGR